MTVLRLAELTWTEVEALDRERTIALLPTGALEAHGPHLPLGTDVVIAEAMAEAAARRLVAEGLVPLLLPAIPYTAAPFATGFPGTVDISGDSVTKIVVEIGLSLAEHGFRSLAIANSHLDPAHLESLHEAAERLAGDGDLLVAFPDLTERRWAERLSEEFRSGACHAGRYEGSIVLAERPELVRDEIRGDLEPNPHSLSEAIRNGVRSFEEAGGAEAYFGDPAAATAEEGRATVETLGAILSEAILEELR